MTAAPYGSLEAARPPGHQGVCQSGEPDRGSPESKALKQALPAPSSLLLARREGSHRGVSITLGLPAPCRMGPACDEGSSMTHRPIVRLGHPALRTPAEEVPHEQIGSAELERLIAEMVEAMRGADGVGLAAPQLGIGLQVFIYLASAAEEQGEDEPRIVINPMIEPEAGDLEEDWEGCLSIPGLRGLVPRHPAVRVRGFDRGGEPLDYCAQGYEARVIQHEFDHLNGVVFLDRMGDLKSLAFLDEWRTYLNDASEDPSAEPEG